MKTERERAKDMSDKEYERFLCIVDILTVYSPPSGLHTSGTE